MNLLIYDTLYEYALLLKKQYESCYQVSCFSNNKNLKNYDIARFDVVLIKINTVDDLYMLFFFLAFFKNIIVYCKDKKLENSLMYVSAVEIINTNAKKKDLISETNIILDKIERNFKSGFKKVV